MTESHRATPEQWTHVAICAEMKQQVPWATADCLLELRARVEALEADQLEQAESHRFCTDAIARRVEALEAAPQDKLDRLIALDAADPTPDAAMTKLRAASAEARPAGGLVERVAQGIAAADDEGLTNMTWNYHARAAIREVAAWLRENDSECQMGGDAAATAELLEQEVNP
jgi:hypothetical protein